MIKGNMIQKYESVNNFSNFKNVKRYLNKYLLNVRKQWSYRTTLGSIFL